MRAVIIGFVAVVAACDDVPCEDQTRSDGGLVVTQAEHGIGWAEASCDSCHLRATLHDRGCTPGVDLVAVRELVETEGLASCGTCHGDNGVEKAAGEPEEPE